MWKKQFKEELLDLQLKVLELEKDSHPAQEFICCRKCGCEIAKTKSKKRR